MERERVLYQEHTPWAAWVDTIYGGVVGSTCLAALLGWETSMAPGSRALVAGLIAWGGWGLRKVIGGLTVHVQEDGLLLHLGTVSLIRRRVPFDQIVTLRSVRYRPLREFGGWGVRGWGERKAWSARGDRAVALDLAGGRQLLIGSDRPERLRERIASASGIRPEASPPSE